MSTRREIIEEARRLYGLGLAVHWLKPQSKHPIDVKWSKGPRKDWAKLRAQFPEVGVLNVGLRLGAASRFEDGTYLIVVDCDVKSGTHEHRKEMEAALAGLIPERTSPRVASGRGNGSMHVYARSSVAVSGYRYTQSKDLVEVKMPSIRPSRRDMETVEPSKLAQGYRIRPAWEISVMGEGQQVVAPPSVHPDTGRPYSWVHALEGFESLPLIEFKDLKANREYEAEVPGEWLDVDLVQSRLADKWVSMIVEGEGVEDRSAALMSVTLAMVNAGFTDPEILSVLTEKDYFLGGVAFDHTSSGSRRAAAKWVAKYTLNKVRAEKSAEAAFSEAVEVSEDLTDEEAAEQEEALLSRPWSERIDRAGGKDDGPPKHTLKNLITILQGSQGENVFTRNEFLRADHHGCNTAWGARAGDPVTDDTLLLVKQWLSESMRFEPSTQLILEAVSLISYQNRYHPVRDWLRTLKWDGVPRLDRWLFEYMSAKGNAAYVEAIGRKSLCAMVARAMTPGVKFDHVLILEGPQGCGKSSAVRILGGEWASDAAINIGDKDAVLALNQAWVLELGELATMNRAEVDHLKQFITQSVDRIRLPYGRLMQEFPRQSVFIGTTNSDSYLKDTSGNRRFWPVKVNQCRFEELERDREQLFAEAKVCIELGEPLWLEDADVRKLAEAEQEGRVFEDSWVDEIGTFLKSPPEGWPKRFAMKDLFGSIGPLGGWKNTKSEQMRAADALKILGYSRKTVRRGKLVGKLWVRETETEEGPRW